VTTGIRETLKSLGDLRVKFDLRLTEDEQFFTEWYSNLPDVSAAEIAALQQIKQRYDYHRETGFLLEGTVNLIVISSLLQVAGFLDAPYRIRSPQSVAIAIDDPDERIAGLIDVLVVQEQFWILVVESKRTSIPIPAAFPQILAYMLANSRPDRPTFGMATNGDGFVFLKLSQIGIKQYDLSREFSLFPRRHELREVLQIMKRLGELAIAQIERSTGD
jgi:hypothetical protein